MAVLMEDFDARDMVAETVFSALIKRGDGGPWRITAKKAYDAAEAFLDERSQRLRNDPDYDYDDD